MAISGDDFHIKGVPADAMIVKPCKTASQVSLQVMHPTAPTSDRKSLQAHNF